MLSWAPGREVQSASFPCSRQGTQRFVFSCSKDEISEVIIVWNSGIVISDIFFCLILETWKWKQPNGLGGVAGLTKTQKRSGFFGNYFAKPMGWKRSALVSSKTIGYFAFALQKRFKDESCRCWKGQSDLLGGGSQPGSATNLVQAAKMSQGLVADWFGCWKYRISGPTCCKIEPFSFKILRFPPKYWIILHTI